METVGYTLIVRHAGEQVLVEFPGGETNALTRPVFDADGEIHTVVQDHGAFWTKFITRAEWAEQALVLDATSFGGWAGADPATATPPPFSFESSYILSLDVATDVLTLTMRIADEKYLAEYRQKFLRR